MRLPSPITASQRKVQFCTSQHVCIWLFNDSGGIISVTSSACLKKAMTYSWTVVKKFSICFASHSYVCLKQV
jgi:hypothetical protein